MKRTLLVVIDALTARIVRPAMEEGHLPFMQRLSERGVFRDNCVSISPSITPAATSSIVTGKYPCDHGVAGAYFYDTDEDRISYFGTDFWAVQRESFSTYFQDFLVRLNRDILRSETLFQTVDRSGLRAGCINYMIFRGDTKHAVNMPWLMKLWPGIPFSEEVEGPNLLYIGDFVSDRPRDDVEELSGPGGMFRRFGFQDDTTAEVLLSLAKSDVWPDFTLAYFPDNDFDSHSDGPASALPTVQKVDSFLGQLFEACGGLDNFLARHAILILGDHSQSNLIADQDARGIDLSDVLKGFDLVNAGAEWTDSDQLMACPNMRAAQVYLRRGYVDDRAKIVDQLLSDSRVDQLMWWESDHNDSTPTTFHVATSDRGRLSFRRAKENADAEDDYGNKWQFEGDLDAVDAKLEDMRLQYREYPNALERIATSFHQPTSGDLWATARPGYEFKLPGTEVHDAGSHGSLHELDSLTALIAAGLPDDVEIPDPVRTVDIVPICKRLLGLEIG